MSIKMWTVKMRCKHTTSDTWFISVGAAGKGLTDSCCFLGQFFLHGRPSRPPTYLVATPGIWCFERPGSSADSDRQGLCVLSVWKRQMGPGICFQLLSLCRHRLAHGDVTDTASSRRDKKKLMWSQIERSVCQRTEQTLSCYYKLLSSQWDSSDKMVLVELVHAIQEGLWF